MAKLRASHQANPQHPEKCIPMDSYDKAKQDINGICECIGCNANATSRVSVKVGDKGQITLFLCEKCRPRFNTALCDINKDIKVSDLLHFSGVKIQVKHLDHLFRIYIKALGKDTVCRIEENKQPKKRAVEFVNDVFNPMEKIERKLSSISERLDKLAGLQAS